MLHVQLVGDFKQNAAAMFALSSVRKRGPGRVALRESQFRRVRFLVFKPRGNVAHEARFGQRLMKLRFEFEGRGCAVDRRGLLLRDSADGLLLDELALERVERRERIVSLLKGRELRSDPEQLAD